MAAVRRRASALGGEWIPIWRDDILSHHRDLTWGRALQWRCILGAASHHDPCPPAQLVNINNYKLRLRGRSDLFRFYFSAVIGGI